MPTLAETQAGRSRDLRSSNPFFAEWLRGPGRGQTGAGQGVNSFDAWLARGRRPAGAPPPTSSGASGSLQPPTTPVGATGQPATDPQSYLSNFLSTVYDPGKPSQAARAALRSYGGLDQTGLYSPFGQFRTAQLSQLAPLYIAQQLQGAPSGPLGPIENFINENSYQNFLQGAIQTGQAPGGGLINQLAQLSRGPTPGPEQVGQGLLRGMLQDPSSVSGLLNATYATQLPGVVSQLLGTYLGRQQEVYETTDPSNRAANYLLYLMGG